MSAAIEPKEKAKPRILKYLMITGCVVLLLFGSFVGCLLLFFSTIGIYSEGSHELAAEWRDEMSVWEAPSEVEHPSAVDIYEFPNGEWAIVKSRSSHGGLWHGGGTVVVKDSDGLIHAFHRGHVCGDGNPFIFGEFNDLRSFYDAMADSDFEVFGFE